MDDHLAALLRGRKILADMSAKLAQRPMSQEALAEIAEGLNKYSRDLDEMIEKVRTPSS